MSIELESFDWLERRGQVPLWKISPPHTLNDVISRNMEETDDDRVSRVLRSLNSTCLACSMCSLGCELASRFDCARDPHVLSNLVPSKFVMIGPHPQWEDLQWHIPFFGPVGTSLESYLHLNGLSRDNFYITNVVKCIVKDGVPSGDQVSQCRSFLDFELNVLKPTLLITLGSFAFSELCPGVEYNSGLCSITESHYGIKTYAIDYPTPDFLAQSDNKAAFEKQVQLLSGLVKRLG